MEGEERTERRKRLRERGKSRKRKGGMRNIRRWEG